MRQPGDPLFDGAEAYEEYLDEHERLFKENIRLRHIIDLVMEHDSNLIDYLERQENQA